MGPDQTLTYSNNPATPPYLADLPDEHTTVIPPAAPGSPYLVFAASKLSGGTGGAVVLRTTDLTNFDFASSLGYSRSAPPTRMERRKRAGACDQKVSALKKARLCRVAPGENYACSAGFCLSFTGSVKQASTICSLQHIICMTYYKGEVGS